MREQLSAQVAKDIQWFYLQIPPSHAKVELKKITTLHIVQLSNVSLDILCVHMRVHTCTHPTFVNITPK